MAAPLLTVVDPQGRRTVTVDKELFTIGRRSSADLQISSTDVSREHAEITRDDDGYILRDRGSRYGTFVNGEAVVERRLVNGDRIRLGRTDAVQLTFAADSFDSTGLRDSGAEITDLAQMAAILNGLRALGSGRVLDEVLTLVMDSALEVTNAERGFVMLADPQGDLDFKVARGRGRFTLPGTSFTTSAKIPRDVFRSGRSQVVNDLMDQEIAAAHGGTIAIGIRHVICVPLRVSPMATGPGGGAEPRVIGVLYLDSRERSTMVSPATRSSLEAFATQAAIAIESARLYAEAAEKVRIERDLRIAAEIQRALLPEPTVETATCDLAAASIPSRMIGGDFYDYLDLPDKQFVFALGDVAGKGPPAAILATMVQSNFVAHADVTNEPADAMARINKALLRRAIEARFATMFYGMLAADGRLSYSNGGQEPPLVLRRSGEVIALETGGPVLGLLPFASYESETLLLEPGDIVVVFSDGVTEARNTAGEELGRDGVLAALAGCHGLKSDTVLERLLGAIRAFSEAAPQADDITALALRYRGGGL